MNALLGTPALGATTNGRNLVSAVIRAVPLSAASKCCQSNPVLLVNGEVTAMARFEP